MQPVAAAGLTITGQGLETVADAGPPPAGQNLKILSDPDSALDLQLFRKVLSQGKKSGGDAASGSENDGKNDDIGKSPELGVASALSSMIMQLISITPENQEGTVSNAGSNCIVAEAKNVSAIEGAEGNITAVIPEIKAQTGADAAQTDQTAAGTAMAQQTSAAQQTETAQQSAIGQQAAGNPVNTVPQVMQMENLLSADPTLQNRKNAQPGQPEAGEKTDVTLFQSNFIEKIRETLKSTAENNMSDSSFGELVSKKDETITANSVKDGSNVSSLTYANSAVDAAKTLKTDEKAAAVERAIDRVIEDFSSVKAGNSEIRIVLEPESLGVLTISVLRTEAGISAKIKSDDKGICSIITDNIPKLIQSMENKGIKVEDVDVVFSQANPDMSFSQHSSKGGGQEKAPIYIAAAEKRPESSDSLGLLDLWQRNLAVDNGISSIIEYRV